MTAPVYPTLLSIVTEGLIQAGEFVPSASLLARYQTEVMEQLKNEIWAGCRQPKMMQTFDYGILIPGQSRYSCPCDFSSDMKMSILMGSVTGTAQSGTLDTIVLQAGSSLALSDILGKEILITSGTGLASVGQVIELANVAGTITVTVTPDFRVAPASGSTYVFVDDSSPVVFDHVAELYSKRRSSYTGMPTRAYPIGDADYDEFIFDRIPDKAYGVKFFYYANLMKTDLSSNLMARLYLEWRNFWIQGIKAKHLMMNDDERGPQEYQLWQGELAKKVATAQYGSDLHEMAQVVTDY